MGWIVFPLSACGWAVVLCCVIVWVGWLMHCSFVPSNPASNTQIPSMPSQDELQAWEMAPYIEAVLSQGRSQAMLQVRLSCACD